MRPKKGSEPVVVDQMVQSIVVAWWLLALMLEHVGGRASNACVEQRAT